MDCGVLGKYLTLNQSSPIRALDMEKILLRAPLPNRPPSPVERDPNLTGASILTPNTGWKTKKKKKHK